MRPAINAADQVADDMPDAALEELRRAINENAAGAEPVDAETALDELLASGLEVRLRAVGNDRGVHCTLARSMLGGGRSPIASVTATSKDVAVVEAYRHALETGAVAHCAVCGDLDAHYLVRSDGAATCEGCQ